MKFVLLSARLVVSVILVFGAVTALNAQDQPAEKRNKRGVDSTQTLDASKTPDSLEPAEYSYEFSQPNFFIKHVVLQHDSSGKGQISFERQDAGEPITEQLQFSPAALKRVIALWEALHYLSPESSYQSEKQFPHLGTMTVAVKKAKVDRKTTFNWTENKDAAALVDEYKH